LQTLAFSFKHNNEAEELSAHDWDGLIRIYNAIDDHPLLSHALGYGHTDLIYLDFHIRITYKSIEYPL